MNTKAAGGLLIGVVLHPIATYFDAYGSGFGLADTMENLLWWDGSPPARTMAFIVLRDVLLIGGLVVGALAVAGVPGIRIPVALIASAIAIGHLPWIIYDFNRVTFDAPPRWVFENPLWYQTSRLSGLLWLAVCVAVVALAATDRSRPTSPYGQPGFQAPVPQPPPVMTPSPPPPPADAT